MPTFTTANQHCTRSSDHNNKVTKSKASKVETSKTESTHKGHDLIYKNPKDSTKILLEWIYKFSKVISYNIFIENCINF
jgi:hypothetical protein